MRDPLGRGSQALKIHEVNLGALEIFEPFWQNMVGLLRTFWAYMNFIFDEVLVRLGEFRFVWWIEIEMIVLYSLE